jgi:hypothetical protein
VLERSATEGNTVRLPEGQLDRALYASVDKVLKALGGKWNRGTGGHVFAAGIGSELADALGAGFAVDAKRTAEQFFSPRAVADKVFDRARLLRGMCVLEPSAGMGALLAEPLRLECLIIAVEKDEKLAAGLVGLLHGLNAGVWPVDFMDWAPGSLPVIDRVLMNPPFGRGKDMAHVERAFGFLRPGGILVAVMSPHWTFATDRQAIAFRAFVASHLNDWEELPDGSFRASGTDVKTGILTLHKGSGGNG